MKSIILICLYVILSSQIGLSQKIVTINSEGVLLSGTLVIPKEETGKAILIISGSGETDRDGNTLPAYKNDALKKLSEQLAGIGYTTLRYDKRGVGSSADTITYRSLRFEDYITDAENWISFMNEKYSDITVIGHSQGALVGMLASQKADVNRFISLAGLTQDLYQTLREQLSKQPKFVSDAAFPIMDSLKIGVKVDSVPAYLQKLLGPSRQDFFMSFMKYDPRIEILKLNIPILIIQGTTDLQITVEGAKELSNISKNADFITIDQMNHVLRQSTDNVNENMSTYTNSVLPLHPQLIKSIDSFISSTSKK